MILWYLLQCQARKVQRSLCICADSPETLLVCFTKYRSRWRLRLYTYIKVRKTARIRNGYNQVPHLSQDTKWESNKITINNINKSQEVSPFPSTSCDHKAAMNRRESMTNTRHNLKKKSTKEVPPWINILLEGPNQLHGVPTLYAH